MWLLLLMTPPLPLLLLLLLLPFQVSDTTTAVIPAVSATATCRCYCLRQIGNLALLLMTQLKKKPSTRGYNDASPCKFYNFYSSGCCTDGRTDLLGRFKTLSLGLLKWIYNSLWRETCIFLQKRNGRTDGWTQPLIEMRRQI